MATKQTKSGWLYDYCKCGEGASFIAERPYGDLHFCLEHWAERKKGEEK